MGVIVCRQHRPTTDRPTDLCPTPHTPEPHLYFSVIDSVPKLSAIIQTVALCMPTVHRPPQSQRNNSSFHGLKYDKSDYRQCNTTQHNTNNTSNHANNERQQLDSKKTSFVRRSRRQSVSQSVNQPLTHTQSVHLTAPSHARTHTHLLTLTQTHSLTVAQTKSQIPKITNQKSQSKLRSSTDSHSLTLTHSHSLTHSLTHRRKIILRCSEFCRCRMSSKIS